MARVKQVKRRNPYTNKQLPIGITKPTLLLQKTHKPSLIVVDVTDDTLSVIDAVDRALLGAGLPPSAKGCDIIVKPESSL